MRPCDRRRHFSLLSSFRRLRHRPAAAQPARFKILQINDVYKIEGLEGGNTGGLARVRTLRKHLE